MNRNWSLEPILQYEMNEIEAKAWKIACMYLEKSQKMFPDYRNSKMPKGDPRKGELFRYCYTLLRKTEGQIADQDYHLYIHAQLDILRNIRKGDAHAFLTPACLIGEKAWKRWMLWKKKYDALVEKKMYTPEKINDIHTDDKIKKDLFKTKLFLTIWFERLDKIDILNSLENGDLFRWVSSGSICGYYLILSPIVKSWINDKKIDLNKNYGIDLKIYSDASKLEDYFKQEFNHEFGD